MKFAHIADVHLGGWRQPEMQTLNLQAFQQTVNICIQEKVDFIIFAGDLFDTAIPSIDTLKEAMSEFKKLKDNGIKCYLVSGSHDYSPTGKTFLDVIERAGFCKNISHIQENEKDNEICVNVLEEENLILVGIPGKKSSAEISYFKRLKIIGDLKSDKLKIFVFHSTLTEAKPEGMDFIDSIDLANLPDGFDYYAAGHLHLVFDENRGQASIVYPGPVFPNNIDELEKLESGSFYLLESEGSKIIKKEKRDIKVKDKIVSEINVGSLSPEQANKKILSEISNLDINNKIFLLKVKGCLSSGKTSDIDWKKISEKVLEKKAYILLKSASGLTTEEMKLDIKTEKTNIDEIENEFIKKYKEQNENFNEFFPLIQHLFNALELEKIESEKKENFEARVFEEANKILKID